MENEEKPKQIAHTLDENDIPVCPDGYYFDEELQVCILDVGNGE